MRRCDWLKAEFLQGLHSDDGEVDQAVIHHLDSHPSEARHMTALCMCVLMSVWTLHCKSISRVTNINTNGQAGEEYE